MKFFEEIKQVKGKEDFKVFAKKYHIIAITLGLLITIFVAFFPADYTESIAENKKNISNIKTDMENRKSEYEKEVNEEYLPKIDEVNVAITKLDEEMVTLNAEKSELSKKLSEKKEAEAEAKRKEEEVKRKEEEAKRKEEEERRKGKWVLESSGYNVWEAYLTPGTYQLSITHNGGGNCIVWAGTRDNQKQNLVVNQIGKGNFAGTFKVNSAGYYTLTFTTDSGFTFEYKGF